MRVITAVVEVPEGFAIAPDFGHCKDFVIYELYENEVVNSFEMDIGYADYMSIIKFLEGMNPDVLICGGISDDAKDALSKTKIKLYDGAKGMSDEVASSFASKQG